MGAFGAWLRKLIDPNYPVKHAVAEMELAYGMLERAHQHMENGNADEAGTCLFGYAAASGIAKDDLKSVMSREPRKTNGPAAYFPKEPEQSDLDHWYDLCHRAMGLINESMTWVNERREYYQAYLRLLCASDAVEQMLETPSPGPCRYCLNFELINKSESSDEGIRRRKEILLWLQTLKEEEQKVIRLRFALDGGEPQTLEQIGESLGLTTERVYQIESSALSRLQQIRASKTTKE